MGGRERDRERDRERERERDDVLLWSFSAACIGCEKGPMRDEERSVRALVGQSCPVLTASQFAGLGGLVI